MRRITLTALMALAVAPAPGIRAGGQYDRGDYDDRPRRPPPDYDEERPRFRDGYGCRPRRYGRICVTARGDCPTRPGPLSAPCGCEIPGFGF